MAKITRITKSAAEKMLADVPQDKQFWCQDNRVFKNMEELAIGLKAMSDETFRYHANETKNDFAKWVQEVVGDTRLSVALLRSSTRLQAVQAAAERVTALESAAR